MGQHSIKHNNSYIESQGKPFRKRTGVYYRGHIRSWRLGRGIGVRRLVGGYPIILATNDLPAFEVWVLEADRG